MPKKMGEVVRGSATNDVYMIVKDFRCYGHEVLLQRVKLKDIINGYNFTPIKNCDSFGSPANFIFGNKAKALQKIDDLETDFSNTQEFIDGQFSSGLLTKEEYDRRLIECGLTRENQSLKV